MPNETEQLLGMLGDVDVLRLAYAASSDYVMRLAFERIKELQVFRGRAELAPAILKQYRSLVPRLRDAVILGAHLYALELAGERDALQEALVITLDQKELRRDPRAAQTAGKLAARVLSRKIPRGKDLNEHELDDLHTALRKEVEP